MWKKDPGRALGINRKLELWTFVFYMGFLLAWTVFVGPLEITWRVFIILTISSNLQFVLHRRMIFTHVRGEHKDWTFWLADLATGIVYGLLFLNLFLVLLERPFPGLSLEETKAWSVIGLVAFHGVSWAAVLSAEKVLRSGLALEKRKPSEGEGSGGSISCRAREISE